MKTALETAQALNLDPAMQDALRRDVHPQARTRLFHEVFEAPLHEQLPDATFSHMDDQRVAFRMSFILSEAIEILEKGLGLRVVMQIDGGGQLYTAAGSDNANLCTAVQGAMADGGKRDVIEVVDGLGDLNVVVNGFALELGVDMRFVDQEVLASNLSKLGADGKPIVADGSDPKYPAGKVLKGPNFVEPQIGRLLRLE